MAIFAVIFGAIIIIVLYSKVLESEKKEVSQMAFNVLLSVIIIVIFLFVISVLLN